MSRSRNPPGEALGQRLAARGSRAQLTRRTMPDGGEVFGGPLATRALRTLGARAMTVDRSVIVGEGFRPEDPESQALYAHEQVHLRGSGGRGGSTHRDTEEIAARRAERMVLQRAMTGGFESGYATAGGDPPREGPDETDDEGAAPGRSQGVPPSPEEGYRALLQQGLAHEEIVARLCRACLDDLEAEGAARDERAGNLQGSF